MSKEKMSISAIDYKFSLSLIRNSIIGILFLFGFVGQAFAQRDSTIDGATPPGVAPGAPAGAYPLSDFEQIDLYSGRLNIRLPILSVGGRGASAFNIPIKINQPPWVVEHDTVDIIAHPEGNIIGFRNQYYAAPNWWNNTYAHAFLPGGRLTVKYLGTSPSLCSGDSYYTETNTHLVFTAPDGTEYEMRDQKRQGLPNFITCGVSFDISRGKVYRTIDGTSATFILDSIDGQIGDIFRVADYGGDSQLLSYHTGILLLGDGTRYKIGLNGRVDWMQDRNGNQVNFYYPTTPQYISYPNRIVDSLNREILFEYDVQDGIYGLHDRITFRGFGGADRIIRISYASLNTVLRSSAELCNGNICDMHLLFPKLDSYGPYNPSRMVSAVWLPPDGGNPARSYQFRYNRYGEVARVILPTGGAIEYDYMGGYINEFLNGALVGTPEGEIGEYTSIRENSVPAPKIGIYRRLKERRVYPTGGTGDVYEGSTSYKALTISPCVSSSPGETPKLYEPCPSVPTMPLSIISKVEVNTYSSSPSIWLSSSEHYFISEPVTQLTDSTWGDRSNLEGKEYVTISYQVTASNQKAPYQKILNDWIERYVATGPFSLGVPTLRSTKTSMLDVNPPLVSLRSSCALSNTACSPTGPAGDGFDVYGNQTDVWEYDYGDNAPGALLRHTYTSFVTTSSVNSLRYDTVNTADGSASNEMPDITKTIHIRSLPFRQEVRNATEATIAATEYKYDENTLTAYAGSITGWIAPGTIGRGNQTTVRRWQDVTCPASPSVCQKGGWVNWDSGTWIETHGWFDQLGNLVKTRDGNGNETTLEYDDRFGLPDGDARQNQPPTTPNWLNGAKTYAFPTRVVNSLGHDAYTQYSYFLGKPVDVEDANGITSSIFYGDYLDRPTQQILAANQTSAKTQTSFAYDEVNHLITVTSDQTNYADNKLKRQTLYDGLGRTTEQRTYESAGAYITVKTAYDGLGRVSQVSNPYRANDSILWTMTQYDALSRVIEVKTPDTATVTTAYLGNKVTVTDQNMKSRSSLTDALGRLVQIVEAPGQLSYQTDYRYDVLNNLTRVRQGGLPKENSGNVIQTRAFLYDSLSRLVYANNPEQDATIQGPSGSGTYWTMKYEYDNNGNLTRRTDARNIVSTYSYDALNRNKEVNYNDNKTPTVKRFYDTAPNGKGRLEHVETANLDPRNGQSADSRTYINSYDALGRATSQTQRFYKGAQITNYTMSRTYNLAGQVLRSTHPITSRYVDYQYDDAGRLSDMKGTLIGSSETIYANNFVYDAAGQMLSERFGTGTPLFHSMEYNNRFQMYSVRLGTSSVLANSASWNRGKLNFYYSDTARGMNNPAVVAADNNGNVSAQEHVVPTVLNPDGSVQASAMVMRDNYFYDSLNRLRKTRGLKNLGNGTWGTIYKQSFVYDQFGNRTIDRRMMMDEDEPTLPFEEQTFGTGINNKVYEANKRTNRLNGMVYDAAGNVLNEFPALRQNDRKYDAENRMTQATGTNGAVNYYVYDGDGRRVRRIVGSDEYWQVYGIGGELVAEYKLVGGSPETMPDKEYGYRNGQLLIVGEKAGSKVWWLVTDHLGSPRIEVDQTGALTSSSLKRHDYLPFGEEMKVGVGTGSIRTTGMGYEMGQVVGARRQKFTGYERDDETGLDFAEARCFASIQGRFTSPDPLFASGQVDDPQSWNRYSFGLNNPLRYTDPFGLYVFDSSVSEEQRKKFNEGLAEAKKNLAKVGEIYGTSSNEYKKVKRALDVYGEEGKNNGVTIYSKEGAGAARVSVEGVAGRRTVDNPNGQNIRVSFDADSFLDGSALFASIAHEGSHAADASEWVSSGFAESKNPTKYRTEVDAYTVGSLTYEGGGRAPFPIILPHYRNRKGMLVYLPDSVDLYKSSWSEADKATLRTTNIDRLLERPKYAGGLYGVTPNRQGGGAFRRGGRF